MSTGRAAVAARERRQVLVGLVALVVVFGVSVLVFSGIPQGWWSERGQTVVVAEMETASRVAVGSPVRIDGAQVGLVRRVGPTDDRLGAEVELGLEDEALPLHRDARATVKWRTTLGGNYYVDLEPGTPRSGPLEGGRIAPSHTAAQVELDEVLGALHEPQRRGLRTMLAELPEAFVRPTGLEEALGRLAEEAPTLAAGLAPLRGREQDADLRRLVGNAAAAMRAIDAPQRPVRDVVEGAAATVAVTARRAAELEQALFRAGRAVPEVTATMQRLETTLGVADPTVERLHEAAGDVAPTLRDLRPTVADADRLLADAQPLLRRLRPATRELVGAGRQAGPLLEDLHRSLVRADETILPDLAKVYEGSGRRTYEMIGPSIAGLNALGGAFDGFSHLAALAPQIGQRNVDTLPCRTYFGDPTATKVLQCEDVLKAFGTLLAPPPNAGPGKARRKGR